MIARSLLVLMLVPSVVAQDLEQVYPATMNWSQQGLFPVCTRDDFWELKSFHLDAGKDLTLDCQAAVVAFGRHETNVLWACVFPNKPVRLRCAGKGDRELASSIFLRFAPAQLGDVFPELTVRGRGGTHLRAEALRISRHKIGWRWSTPAGNPTIVQPGWILVDVETDDGRRFFGVDRNAGTVEYVPEFEAKPLPPKTPIGSAEARAAFDQVWEAFDQGYAGFVLLPDVDWKKLGKSHRLLARDAGDTYTLAAVLAEMLGHLDDLHVSVRCGDDWIPMETRERPLNGNWKATQAAIGATHQAGADLHWGRSEDGIGYLGVHRLGDPELPEQVDAALEQLADTWALVIDLRFNGGGDELLARGVAGRFLAQEVVYSRNRYRSGPKHDDLGPLLDRTVAPRGAWRYAAPVVVLQGRRTLSSAESLALMLAQIPGVTVMGAPTGGSSGNPRLIELECGIVVRQPRWLDLDPAGRPIEHVGVAPGMPVEARGFSDDHDPVIEAALARLRSIPSEARTTGR